MDTNENRPLVGSGPFCLIQKQDSETVLVLEGRLLRLETLVQIPRQTGRPEGGRSYDTISLIPFSQIRERGYRARNDGETILTLQVDRSREIPAAEVLTTLPDEPVSLEGDIAFDMTTDEYAALIQRVVEEEIGNGEGANFVVPRTSSGRIRSFNTAKAFSIFKSLLTHDYGTYWKFIFYDGERYFIGSTPERHLYVEKNRVKMNPISGTFRKEKAYARRDDFKRDLLAFLNDPKEINELFMVVDEELKMMSKLCEQGGAIIGPLLKEMSRLIHSEYLLSGESDKDIFDLFRDSMFAATVTGSPVENACNIIWKYSGSSRRYYGSALMLVGRDDDGHDFLDSPITIRTVEIDGQGRFQMAVGATLVRDSVPEQEVKETESKSSALMAGIVGGTAPPGAPLLSRLANDDEIQETLQFRNQYLSNFWFFKQETRLRSDFDLSRIRITIVHNEDDFVYMQRHIFRSFGMTVDIVPWTEYQFESDSADITLLGPGPGNPNRTDDPKMVRNLAVVEKILAQRRKSLFICLGHQLLCRGLEIPVEKKAVPLQGVQEKIPLFGREERVGFYNTFTGKVQREYPELELAVAAHSDELLAVRGAFFVGFQFHPESILTKNGDAILKEAVAYLLSKR